MSDSLDREISILRTSFWSARDPEGRAFVPLADAHRRKGELEEARALLQDGLERHPDFASGHLVAARVARDRGDLVSAREHLDRVLDLDHANITALIERAGTRASEGDREGAMEDLTAALESDPSNDDARQRLDTLESGAGWDVEVAPMEEAEVPDSDGAIYTRTMGDLYARQGFRDQAIEVYEHLLHADPGNEELALRLEELKAPDAQPSDADSFPDAEVGTGHALVRAGVPTEAETSGERSIAQYFEDLVAWVPGAVPIQSLAPSVEEKPERDESADSVGVYDSGLDESEEAEAPTSGVEQDGEPRTHDLPAEAGTPDLVEVTEISDSPVPESIVNGQNKPPAEAGADSSEDVDEPDESDLDDFNLWLRSLQP